MVYRKPNSSLAQVERADDALYELYKLALDSLPMKDWDTARDLLAEITPVLAAVRMQRERQRFIGEFYQTQARFQSTATADTLAFFGKEG